MSTDINGMFCCAEETTVAVAGIIKSGLIQDSMAVNWTEPLPFKKRHLLKIHSNESHIIKLCMSLITVFLHFFCAKNSIIINKRSLGRFEKKSKDYQVDHTTNQKVHW